MQLSVVRTLSGAAVLVVLAARSGLPRWPRCGRALHFLRDLTKAQFVSIWVGSKPSSEALRKGMLG